MKALSYVEFKKCYLIIYLSVIVAKSTPCTTTLHVVFIMLIKYLSKLNAHIAVNLRSVDPQGKALSAAGCGGGDG